MLLDGHESHCNYPFLNYAFKHRILVFVLPAHSSHLTQPLDIGLFGPLQHHYGVLVAEWFKGGYPAICKADFFPLLKSAREQTYTSNNIEGAWEGAGLVPYNRRKVLERIGAPLPQKNEEESANNILKTPKKPHEFRQILKYSEQLVLHDGPKHLILSALEKLGNSGMAGQAQEAIAKHETMFLKKRLKMKGNHKNSRVKIPLKNPGHAKLMTQERIDEVRQEYEQKEQANAEKLAKRGGGKGGEKEVKSKSKATAQVKTNIRAGSRAKRDAPDSDTIVVDG